MGISYTQLMNYCPKALSYNFKIKYNENKGMYFIELIIKKLTQKKERKMPEPFSEDEPQLIEDYLSCEHSFMPIDSTGEMLSCIKCGYIVKRDELKKNNPFNG